MLWPLSAAKAARSSSGRSGSISGGGPAAEESSVWILCCTTGHDSASDAQLCKGFLLQWTSVQQIEKASSGQRCCAILWPLPTSMAAHSPLGSSGSVTGATQPQQRSPVPESCTAHQKLNLNSDTILYCLRHFSRLAVQSHIKARETSLEALMRSGLQYADRFWRMLPIPYYILNLAGTNVLVLNHQQLF